MVLLRSFVAYADSQAATGGLLKEIMGEVASIRLESNMLKQQLRERHAESAALKKAFTDARREIGEGRQGLGGIGARIERIERVDRDIEKRIGDIEAACERIEHAVEAFRDHE
ncbi:hypothetical protein KD986_01115 [Treponema pallidum]|nr:hypothetical protein KD986_01115 [Treponema pallidum]